MNIVYKICMYIYLLAIYRVANLMINYSGPYSIKQ